MTRRYPTGSPINWRKTARPRRRAAAPWADSCASRCAMARTRTSRRPSMSTAVRAPASPAPDSFRARNCPTTISTTPTRPTSWWRSSIRDRARLRHHQACQSLRRGHGRALRDAYLAALACDTQRLWRRPGLQHATGRRHGRRDFQDLHRSDHRARRRRRCQQDSRRQEESAPVDRRRPARPARRPRPRSVAGGFLVQTRDNGRVTREAESRDQAPAQRDRKSPTCCSPSPWASM